MALFLASELLLAVLVSGLTTEVFLVLSELRALDLVIVLSSRLSPDLTADERLLALRSEAEYVDVFLSLVLALATDGV